MPPDLAVATVATASHLAQVRVLAASVREHHPGVPVFLVLIDELPPGVVVGGEPLALLPLRALAPAAREHAWFRHTLMQLAVAAKAWALRHLLAAGFRAVLYLDADMQVLAPLDDLLARVRRHALVLTPHFVAPAAGDQALARELLVLRAGAFNAGVVGTSDRPEAHRFLAWWERRIADHARRAPEHGVHYDQRWLDLAPGVVGDLHVVRDPAINVGHWALRERLAAAAPRLMHFSGFDAAAPAVVSRHAPTLSLAALGRSAPLFTDYAARLRAAGDPVLRTIPWAWGRFDDGTPVPDAARRRHRGLGAGATRFGDPLRTGPGSFRAWLDGAPV